MRYRAFNFVKMHATLKTTPPDAAGVADRPMTTHDLAQMIESAEAETGGRLTEYRPSK